MGPHSSITGWLRVGIGAVVALILFGIGYGASYAKRVSQTVTPLAMVVSPSVSPTASTPISTPSVSPTASAPISTPSSSTQRVSNPKIAAGASQPSADVSASPVASSSITTSSPTAYQDTDLHFSFSYPSTWKVNKDVFLFLSCLYLNSPENLATEDDMLLGKFDAMLCEIASPNLVGADDQTLLNDTYRGLINGGTSSDRISAVTINGLSGYAVSGVVPSNGIKALSVELVRNYQYMLIFPGNATNQNDLSSAQQGILNSFRAI